MTGLIVVPRTMDAAHNELYFSAANVPHNEHCFANIVKYVAQISSKSGPW